MEEQLQSEPSGGPLVLKRRRSVGLRTASVIAVAALVVGAAVAWSTIRLFGPSTTKLDDPPAATAQVTQGSIGSSFRLNAVAAWPTTPAALNGASGIVTTVDIEQGADVTEGQRLYSVGMRPVVAAKGDIPAFGTISPGDSGNHISQFQRFLTDAGLWSGGITGQYSNAMQPAVMAWQKASGFPADGVVLQGDVVWLPALPARINLEREVIARGLPIDAGVGKIVALVVCRF